MPYSDVLRYGFNGIGAKKDLSTKKYSFNSCFMKKLNEIVYENKNRSKRHKYASSKASAASNIFWSSASTTSDGEGFGCH